MIMSKKYNDFSLFFRQNLETYIYLGRKEGEPFQLALVQHTRNNKNVTPVWTPKNGRPSQAIMKEAIEEYQMSGQDTNWPLWIPMITDPSVYTVLSEYCGVDFATGDIWLTDEFKTTFPPLAKIGKRLVLNKLKQDKKFVVHIGHDADKVYSIHKLLKASGLQYHEVEIIERSAASGGLENHINVDIKKGKSTTILDLGIDTFFIDHHENEYDNTACVLDNMGFDIEPDAMTFLDLGVNSEIKTTDLNWSNLARYMNGEQLEKLFSNPGQILMSVEHSDIKHEYSKILKRWKGDMKEMKETRKKLYWCVEATTYGKAVFVPWVRKGASQIAFRDMHAKYFISVNAHKNGSTFAIMADRNVNLKIPANVIKKVKELSSDVFQVSESLLLLGGSKAPETFINQRPQQLMVELKKIFKGE